MITHIRLISSVVAGVENSPNYLHMKTNIQKQQERKCTETNTDTATLQHIEHVSDPAYKNTEW